jgi:transglutaminase-like putative cysteine protease
MQLTVRHDTVYRYARPVTFNEHRLMFRPRDSHDLRLLDTALSITPPASVRWYHDVFSNSIAIATFDEAADRLSFESTIVIDHFGLDSLVFPIAPYARAFPFTYSAEDIPDLGRTIERHYPDPDNRLAAWAHGLVPEAGPTETQVLLLLMTQAIQAKIRYAERPEPGVQTPLETLRSGAGSCRDLALLMMEAARSLGLAARFVTGYLYDPALDSGGVGLVGSGATHAWAQIYLPGAGWIEVDPSNGLIGGANLIRVGVARDPSQAIPLQGSYNGTPEDFLDLTVTVTVTRDGANGSPQP